MTGNPTKIRIIGGKSLVDVRRENAKMLDFW